MHVLPGGVKEAAGSVLSRNIIHNIRIHPLVNQVDEASVSYRGHDGLCFVLLDGAESTAGNGAQSR